VNNVLDIKSLSFAWGRREVLADVNLGVRQGELVSLLGPNGSGKSTILTLIAGLAPPWRGQIAWHLGGSPAAGFQPGHPDVLGRIGVVFQSPGLDQTLSARENLHLAARMSGLGRREARRRADELLAFAELEDRADERIKQLSGGMRRRVDLARALIHDPEVLLLDEPTVGLDHVSFERFWQRIADVRALKRLTVICATHRPDEAAKSDRLVMISGGKVVYEGTPEATVRGLGRDLLVVESTEPKPQAQLVSQQLSVVTRVTGPKSFVVEVPAESDGAALVVRVVESLPSGSLTSIALRRPDLGDAFVKIAGGSLDGTTAAQPEAA